MKLHQIAHARSGDKGDISNISLIAFDPGDFEFLKSEVTAERVRQHFADTVSGKVDRYELPQFSALNFVLHDALAGGVTRSLALDTHGKGMSFRLLDMEIDERPSRSMDRSTKGEAR